MKDNLKYYALLLIRTVLKLFHIFPIKSNRIVFYSFNGKQYSCNPRRISEYLLEHYPGRYEIIWAFKKPCNYMAILPPGIKAVKYRSPKYYYYAKTAKIIIQNVQGYGELSRRKGQYIIQTWHASNGYKKQGNYTGIKRKLELLYHKDYSYVLSGSESMTVRRVRGTMDFEGDVIHGTPRMDMLFRNNEEVNSKVRKAFSLNNNEKILLYAPTWRNDRYNNDYGLDYYRTLNAFENKFDHKWVLLIRFHPNVRRYQIQFNDRILDATNYPDMQELLCTADALISDYSSCIWDYSFRKRPCFLYCIDLEKYGNDRDFDIPISDWRFPIARNMDELEKIIETFDEKDFIGNINRHHMEMGNYEDGHSTERIVDLINTLCGDKVV